VLRYGEGLQVGYRWYQTQGIAPLFPFGHGLSYTTFALSELVVTPRRTDGTSPLTVELTVTNTGEVAGAEVAQVYLGLPETAQEPPKRLVGFRKVRLEPGASERINVPIDPAATSHPVSVWDPCVHDFAVVPGGYTVFVGTSSEDTPLSATVTIG
jgi:beta-glucosidase